MAWPSDHRVSVVSPTITTASGSCRRRSAIDADPGWRIRGGDDVAAPRPQHVAADDGGELDRPHQAGWQPGAARLPERRAEQVPALLERVGDRDQDALAVDQQVGQVVGDEVAERDRQQAGPDGAQPDRPGDREGEQDDEAEPGEQDERLDRDAGRAEDVEEGLGLGQAVEDDRGHPERHERHVRAGPARLEEPAAERAPVDAALLVDQPEPGEPAEEPEPDREGLASRAPLVAPELGHHRERVGGVPDEDHEQQGRARLHDELQPDEDGEPDRARPASEPLRVVGRCPALDVGSRQDPGRHVVDRRERVEEVPGRADDRADDGQADPAVVPQEEGRDLPVARPAGDPLADDPQPADQPDDAQPDSAARPAAASPAR